MTDVPHPPQRAFPLVFAKDVAESAEFYELLGFRRERQSPPQGPPTYVALSRGEGDLAVLEPDWARAHGFEVAERASGFELFVPVADTDAELCRLRAAGVKVLREPADTPWGERIAHLAAPAGHAVAIASRPDAGTAAAAAIPATTATTEATP